MSGFRSHLWKSLKNKFFRDEYVAETVRTGIAFQIKAMRDSRGWSQHDLAEKMGKKQSAIARLEDPSYGKYSLQTLLEVAPAFDVWLSVQFVPFSEGLRRTADLSPTSLNAVSFSEDWEGREIGVSTTSSTRIEIWVKPESYQPKAIGLRPPLHGGSSNSSFFHTSTVKHYAIGAK